MDSPVDEIMISYIYDPSVSHISLLSALVYSLDMYTYDPVFGPLEKRGPFGLFFLHFPCAFPCAAEDAEDVRKDWRRETGGASAKFHHHQSAVLQLLQELEVPFLQPSAFQGVQLNINYCVTLRM